MFSHMSTVKGRKGAWTYPKTQNMKKNEGSGQLISYHGSNIIHTERQTHSWLNNAKMLPFCSKNSSPVSIMS